MNQATAASGSDLGERLKASELKFTGLRTHLAVAEARMAELNQTVGAAKWRIAQKDKIDDVLVTAQKRFHARVVGSYEQLLTHIVSDILPSDIKIKLDLGTARGKPALDIIAQRSSGDINVLRSSGGSLRNVLSTGLRAAAIIKSKQRRFMALDEAECWIRPDHIPAYGRVLARLARELGLQTILVTHHDPNLFPDAHIVTLDGRPETGLTALSTSPAHVVTPALAADDVRIASLRLINFMSHADTFVPLAPDITFLTGDNDIGKSAILAGLRAVANSDFRDEDIRHGETATTIEIRFTDGREISVTRSLKKHIKTLWKLTHPNGEVDSSEGVESPDFITKLIAMPMHGDLDLHIATQDPPTFLLSQGPSQRAELLSIGEEASHLDQLLDTWKRQQKDDASLIKAGEQELTSLLKTIETLQPIDALQHLLPSLADDLKTILTAQQKLHDIAALQQALSTAKSSTDQQADIIARFTLPDTPEMRPCDALRDHISRIKDQDMQVERQAATVQALTQLPDGFDGNQREEDSKALGQYIAALDAATRQCAQNHKRYIAFQHLQDPEPLDATTDLTSHIASLTDHTRTVMAAKAELDQAEASLQEVIAALVAWRDSNHSQCPTCGQEGFDPLAHL